jgi:hypothetical protein
MGNTPSLEDQLIDVKLIVKTRERAEKKCSKNRTKQVMSTSNPTPHHLRFSTSPRPTPAPLAPRFEQLASVKKAIKEGNIEGQGYTRRMRAIREKQSGLNYLKLASRLDAFAR